MACQLEKQGKQVSLLAIFEGFVPNSMNTHVPFLYRLGVFWRHIPQWIKDYSSMNSGDLRHRIRSMVTKARVKLQHRPDLEQRARVEEILDTDLSKVPNRNVELTQVHSRALHLYRPNRYGGIVTLFRANNRSFNEVVFGSLDPKMGWGSLAMGGVDVKIVDGFHRNIHLPPYVNSLAAELSHCLGMKS
jgi:aspartate racemase